MEHENSRQKKSLAERLTSPAGYWSLAATGVVLLVVMMAWLLRNCMSEPLLSIERSDRIELTPVQIQSIRDIGQWEFLSVTDEELVDTVRKGLFRDDHLVRIYYGTMRLGIDLAKVSEGWITTSGDSVVLTLPPVGLLDERFIDEARTQSFHESGRWSAHDREALYQKARRQMLAHGLTPQNLRSAEDNADAQFRRLLRSMGFEQVIIRFGRE
jgi:hypothetical protein